MQNMHHEVLNTQQKEILPLIYSFGSNFYLAGGTGLALQYGHRQSIDFDLFSDTPFDSQKIRGKIRSQYPIDQIMVDSSEELTIIVHSVKCTFLYYPFIVPRTVKIDKELYAPDPITIGAMKAFALGQRAKWKDYVDLYFILRHYSLNEIIIRSEEIYGNEFNEKLFREQLAYHDDINYSESVVYMSGFEVEKETILKYLIDISLS